jgi:hypothetical protein
MNYNQGFHSVIIMKKTAIFLTLALAALPLFAQPGTVDHKPNACLTGDEMTVLSAVTEDKGLLRAYFRHTGTTDWCSVDGTNNGAASNVVMPKFATGDEIEYYFVVLDGKKIVAKSPEIYRLKATPRCEAPTARHLTMIAMECLPPGQNPAASSMSAGYAAAGTLTSTPPPVGSPERPRFIVGNQ